MLHKDKADSIGFKIAAPCRASWDAMDGDERTRYCTQCRLNVYNISSMSAGEAEEFLRGRVNERVCVRFYKRHDGTIITDDCPVGLKKLRDVGRLIRMAAVSVIAMLFSAAPTRAESDPLDRSAIAPQPMRFPLHRELPDFVKPVVSGRPSSKREVLMGAVCNDYAPYVKEMQQTIMEKWKAYHFVEKKSPVVTFKVHADGDVSGVAIQHSSGSDEKDQAAIQVIESASPYRKLPFHESEVEIQFTFSQKDSI